MQLLLKICSRCGKVIPYPKTYCQSCIPNVDMDKRAYKAKADKRYNSKRNPKYVKFYKSANWRILSDKYRQDKQYKCEICGKYATEVHHKTPIQTDDGWERRLDYNELQCLCIDCHNKIHGRFSKRNTKPRGR